jgi:hypothetical protein
MLDADAYSNTGVGGASNVGGAGNGSGSSGKAGSSGAPNAVDPSKSASACAAYCKGYRVHCSSELGNRDCLEACAQQVNANGEQCQALGIRALNCLAPRFATTGPSPGCNAALSGAAAACTSELISFQTCQPVPTPTPNPMPARDCRVTDGGGSGDCIQVYECTDGPYVVQCISTGDGAQACSCIPPMGAVQFAMYGLSPNPCQTAALDCGFL